MNRPGEGSAAINASFQTFISPDGRSVAQLGLDLSQAVVPDRKYAADTCSLLYSNQTVRIIFGQERFNGDGLRSAVVVKMSPRAVVQLLAMIDSTMPASFVEALLGTEGVEVQKLASSTMEPAQVTVVLAANLAMPAVSGMEACIDFYQASPFALGVTMQSHSDKLAVEAVVRVDLSTGLLLGLLEELRRIRTQFGSVQMWSPKI
jgi:hypothetical protein